MSKIQIAGIWVDVMRVALEDIKDGEPISDSDWWTAHEKEIEIGMAILHSLDLATLRPGSTAENKIYDATNALVRIRNRQSARYCQHRDFRLLSEFQKQ
jgi:hypothetical protein